MVSPAESKTVVDKRFDFENSISVYVNSSLLAFIRGSPVRGFKYANPTSKTALKVTEVQPLPLDEYLRQFALTAVKSFFAMLSGGCDEGCRTLSEKVFLLDSIAGHWVE